LQRVVTTDSDETFLSGGVGVPHPLMWPALHHFRDIKNEVHAHQGIETIHAEEPRESRHRKETAK
jgi:hypothetical protein